MSKLYPFYKKLDEIEVATMRLKQAYRDGEMAAARAQHGKLETLTQELYSTKLWEGIENPKG